MLVESAEQVLHLVQLLDAFAAQHAAVGSEALVGVDCEGISRQRNLSLIQVSPTPLTAQIAFNGACFVIDLLRVNPFSLGLKRILEETKIVKIFHDFCEDTSALVNQYDVHCSKVFDSQVAHRKLTAEPSHRDQNISLNACLQHYLGVQNDFKASMNKEMGTNPALWWKVTYIA